MPFNVTPLALPDVILIEPRVFRDPRGFFLETYQEADFRAAGITRSFAQHNHSFSTKGVLRGMHYQQAPYAQGKLVQVALGTVWDVAVDMREGSSTYGKWVAAELSGENHHALWIPPGFAHGFVVLSDSVHFLYKCTAPYTPAAERGFRWDDPDVAIDWPTREVTLSQRDQALPAFASAEPIKAAGAE